MPGSRPEWTPGMKGEVSEFVLCSLWTAGRCGLHPPPHARDTCAHGPPGASFSYMNRMLSFLSFCYWPSFFKPLLQPPGLSPPSAPAQQISLQGRMASLLPCGAQVCWSFSSSSGVLWLIPQRSALVSPPPGSLLGFPSDQMQTELSGLCPHRKQLRCPRRPAPPGLGEEAARHNVKEHNEIQRTKQ